MGDVLPGVDGSRGRIHGFLGEEGPDGVGLGGPLGVEDYLGGRHLGVPVNLPGAFGVQIPTGELISASFQALRVSGYMALVYGLGQHLLIGQIFFHGVAVLVIVNQGVAVAGVVELGAVVVSFILGADGFVAGEALQIVALLVGDDQATTFCSIRMMHLVGFLADFCAGLTRKHLDIVGGCGSARTT